MCAAGSCLCSEASTPKSSLTFLFAQGLSGRYQHVTPAGLALELCITAADLLDSIEDEEFGVGLSQGQALNVATALLMLSYMSLGRLSEANGPAKARRAAQALEAAMLRACQGQSLDLAFEACGNVTEQEYLQMVEWKAAALHSCACSVGALLSTDDEAKIEAAVQYGKWLGLARQVRNDALAIASGGDKSDIRRRKKTLPVIYALEQCNGSDLEILHRVYAASTSPTPEEEARVREIIAGVGGVHYAMVMADVFRQRSIQCVEGTGVTAEIRNRLRELANL